MLAPMPKQASKPVSSSQEDMRPCQVAGHMPTCLSAEQLMMLMSPSCACSFSKSVATCTTNQTSGLP